MTTSIVNISDREKSVLASLYQHGASSIGTLAKLTLVNRTSLYPIMHNLLIKGLVTKGENRGTTLYAAITLDELNEWIERKKDDAEKAMTELQSWMKNQVLKQTDTLFTEIKHYEGQEGVMNLYDDTWRNNKEKVIHALTDYEKAYEIMGDRFLRDDYFKKRISHGVHVKSLLPESPIGIKELETAESLLREMRFIDLFADLGIEMNIYDDKVAIIAFDKQNPSGVLIKNPIIANAFKNIFQYLWLHADTKSTKK